MWRCAVSAAMHRHQSCICFRRFRAILMAVSGNCCWKGCWVCHLLPRRAEVEKRVLETVWKLMWFHWFQQYYYHQLTQVQREFVQHFYIFLCRFLPISSTTVWKNSIKSLELTSKEKMFTTCLWTALHGWWNASERISVKEINPLIEQDYCSPKLHVWEVSTVFK